jgi:amino acid transporter
MSIFRRKSIERITQDAANDQGHSVGLNKVLGKWDLTFMGIAAIIGAGSFSSMGTACASGGPGVVILFIICGIACGFTALCYSEFASRIPVSGSAYTYAYASFGEMIAWVIGWALLLEYSIGNIYVAFSWSDYFTNLLESFHLHMPDWMTISYAEAKKTLADSAEAKAAWKDAPMLGSLRIIFDFPALLINFLITWLVYVGVKESRNISNLMVFIKLAVVPFTLIQPTGFRKVKLVKVIHSCLMDSLV